jgi:hypothetical protein
MGCGVMRQFSRSFWFVVRLILEHALENVSRLLHIVVVAMRMKENRAVHELRLEVSVAGKNLFATGVAYLHKVFPNHDRISYKELGMSPVRLSFVL